MGIIIQLAIYAVLIAGTANAVEFNIVTASARGTYIVIGQNLCTVVAPDAGFDCEALPSAGSSENVFRLRFEKDVKLAIAQSDVYQAFIDKADAGNRDAANLIRPLKVVLPLYNEEIYFLVRADSPLTYVHQIKDARIAAGEYGSGTALTSVTLYNLLFHTPLPKPQYLNNDDALRALIAKTVDVVVVVGGQPMKFLTDMAPEAKALVKLLKFDRDHVTAADALKTYFPVTVRAASYPNLLAEDLPGLAVRAYLVTYDFGLPATKSYLAKFARSLCQHLPELQASGHPKWKEVSLDLPELGAGWSYYYPTAREIRACAAPVKAVPVRASCGQVEYTLGLCGKS